MEPINIRDIVELARFEFRRYGFRADGGRVETVTARGESGSGLKCGFDAEPATGQAAFSQYRVIPHFRIWGVSNAESPDFLKVDAERLPLDLSVSYEHIDSGSNGYSARYELRSRVFGDPPRTGTDKQALGAIMATRTYKVVIETPEDPKGYNYSVSIFRHDEAIAEYRAAPHQALSAIGRVIGENLETER